MRLLEFLILLLVAILPFISQRKSIQSNHKIIACFLIGVFLSHLIIEGFRWQMGLIYLAYIITLLVICKKYTFFKGGWFRKFSIGIILVFMVGTGLCLSIVLPVFDLPTPHGEYGVGARYVHLISSQKELMTPKEGDYRELALKIWYPAEVHGEHREPYLQDAGRQGFAHKYNLPHGMFNYLEYVKTHTFADASPAAGKFPVLIFSHGYYSQAFGYYALIEEIVSHGFIVINLNHTYESVGATFPKGEIKFYDREYDQKKNNAEMAAMIWEATENYKKARTLEEKKKAVHHLLKDYYAAEITDRWASDIMEVVEQIDILAEESQLCEHMDKDKIGVLGHSQGGSAAGQALLRNSSILAGINLDGVQWGEAVDTFFNKPFMVLSSDWPKEHPDFNEVAYQRNDSQDFYRVRIKNTGHSNFMDIPFMVNFPMLNEAGPIDPDQASYAAAQLVVGFFNVYLNGEEINLLDLHVSFPELEIRKR